MLHELHQSACNKHFAPTIPQPPNMSYTASRLILRIFPQIPEIQEDKHKPRDFYKLLFIRLLLCTKIQGTYFKISALYFKIYGLYFWLFGTPDTQQVTKPQKFRFFALFSVLPDNAFTMCGDECL